MSDPLALSAVSAVLQFYLFNMYTSVASAFGGQPAVTSQAPDLVQQGLTKPENQINLFLHQVTYNASWRNVALPSVAADGKTRLTSPPLALDLHYLLTAYGSADWQAEGLLGYALMMLHENSIITRDDISFALHNLPGSNNMINSLKGSTLADQVEMIKITPATLGREEMAWLWTALKADYRPTFPFQVSVVLIQPQRDTTLALPVLFRTIQATPIQPAQLVAIEIPNNQLAAAFTDTVTVTGEFLGGISQVSLSHPRLGLRFPVTISNVLSTSLQFIPGSQTTYPAGVPPGIYNVVGQFLNPAKTQVIESTNTLPIALAASLPATQTQAATHNADGTYTVSINFTPSIWEGQDVSLSLSSLTAPPPPAPLFTMTFPALPFTGNSNTSLKFQLPATFPAGTYLARLTVDGVTSQVDVNWVPTPPVFTGPMVTITL